MNPPPLLDLLRPEAVRWGTICGTGQWSVSFRKRGDLVFFRVDHGDCRFRRMGHETLSLAKGDCLVVHTCAPFTLASDLDVEPVDSWTLVGRTRSTEMQLGVGGEPSAVVRGGRFVFGAGDRDPLMQLLPPIVHLRSGSERSGRVRALLAMIEAEDAGPDPWSASASSCLVELVLIELLREVGRSPEPVGPGLLAGMADPVVSRALTALHGDIARPWTSGVLARSCGRSRSAFNQRFAAVLGMAPMTYLRRLRMAVAMEELRRRRRGVAEIALLVGFQSGSAFSAAFARAIGCSPRAYAARSAAARIQRSARS